MEALPATDVRRRRMFSHALAVRPVDYLCNWLSRVATHGNCRRWGRGDAARCSRSAYCWNDEGANDVVITTNDAVTVICLSRDSRTLQATPRAASGKKKGRYGILSFPLLSFLFSLISLSWLPLTNLPPFPFCSFPVPGSPPLNPAGGLCKRCELSPLVLTEPRLIKGFWWILI